VSLLLALPLAEYFVRGWNSLWSGIELKISYEGNIPFLISLLILMGLTALLAGVYPAFYISGFKPIQILRGTTKFGGSTLFTKSLLVLQFSIALSAVIFALAFYFNSRYQKEYDLGYNYRSVIQVPLDNPSQFLPLENALSSNPIIKQVGGTQQHIFNSSYKVAARNENGIEKEIDMLNVGNNYFETVGIRLVAGKDFNIESKSDMEESIIVNEEFMRAFSLGSDALGKRFLLNDTTQVFIKGIVKDVYLRALFAPLSPVAFRYVPEDSYKILVASASPGQLIEMNEVIKAEWKKLFPNILYSGQFMEHEMVMVLEHFDGVVLIYTFLGLVAIVMSASGLYALISLNLQKRTKELGIRKIMGAPLPHMLIQSSRLFIIVMILSFCVGSLVGSLMVNAMMDNIWEYYVAVNASIISLAILILFTIATFTIGAKVIEASIKKPVDSLRYE
jgi:putative ABC transport system permease protein